MGNWNCTLENLVVKQFADIYRNKRVLVTGHTGFKGSWLTLWLKNLGAEVIGISLPPVTSPSHWNITNQTIDSRFIDILDFKTLSRVFDETKPDIIFHLAAQALVKKSYANPLETWSTNVLGTANILEASRHTSSVKTIVVITTDKCYENQEWTWGYRENDPLGGHDPYSASKAATELVVASYRNSFFNSNSSVLISTARAGNVIGGGDWAEDRLVPDLIRSIQNNELLEIRAPNSTRPWQHVLESLSGYLMLGQCLHSGSRNFAQAWNFGPELESNRPVSEVLRILGQNWEKIFWRISEKSHPHEARLLYLDSTKAKTEMGWHSVWSLDEAVKKTAEWYRAYLEKKEVISNQQLEQYIKAAADSNAGWIES